MRIPFNEKEEMLSQGMHYETYGLFGGYPYSEIEILNQPITPKENLLRFLRGEEYEWVPDAGCDLVEITPDINPDNVAVGFYGGVDSFGVVWEALETGMPAMVRPGNPKLRDIAEWESLEIADPDSWDWKGEAEKYKIHSRDRFHRGGCLTGLFERMISLMDFEGAAMALVEDPDEVGRFLTAVTDYNLKVMKHLVEDFHVDGIYLGDDWAGQLAPFFSPSVARELFLPHLKRMADYAHSCGLTFMLHSCGNGIDFIPVWADAGVDIWQFQNNAIDIDKALEMANGRLKLEGYWAIPEGLNEEEAEQFIWDTQQRYCTGGQMLAAFCDANFMVSPFVRRAAYRTARKIAGLKG